MPHKTKGRAGHLQEWEGCRGTFFLIRIKKRLVSELQKQMSNADRYCSKADTEQLQAYLVANFQKKMELNIKCNSRKHGDNPELLGKCHLVNLHDIKAGGCLKMDVWDSIPHTVRGSSLYLHFKAFALVTFV